MLAGRPEPDLLLFVRDGRLASIEIVSYSDDVYDVFPPPGEFGPVFAPSTEKPDPPNSSTDRTADCTADPGSGAAPRPTGLGGGVWFLTSHPQRQGHEVKNQTRRKGVGTGKEEERKRQRGERDQRREERGEGRGRDGKEERAAAPAAGDRRAREDAEGGGGAKKGGGDGGSGRSKQGRRARRTCRGVSRRLWTEQRSTR
jgi:hypothetical protein